jgi:hypothetical protein
LPRIGALSCNGPLSEEDRVAVRLRGVGGEKIITYKDNNYKYTNSGIAAGNISFGGFIEVGYQGGSNYMVTLALENNITIAGKYNGNETDDSKFSDLITVRYLVRINTNAILIMRNGSKLTNFYGNSDNVVVCIRSQVGVDEYGTFEMQGGSITGNVINSGVTSASIVWAYTSRCVFNKTGGIIDNSPNNKFYRYNTGYEIPRTEGAWSHE